MCWLRSPKKKISRDGRTGCLPVGPRVGEAFETLLALERLFSRMQALVLGQVVLVFERLGTDVALMGTLTCGQDD